MFEKLLMNLDYYILRFFKFVFFLTFWIVKKNIPWYDPPQIF